MKCIIEGGWFYTTASYEEAVVCARAQTNHTGGRSIFCPERGFVATERRPDRGQTTNTIWGIEDPRVAIGPLRRGEWVSIVEVPHLW